MSAEVLERLEADRMRAVADALAGWPGDGAGGHAEADTEFLVALCLPLADELRRYHAWTLRRAQAQPVAGMAPTVPCAMGCAACWPKACACSTAPPPPRDSPGGT